MNTTIRYIGLIAYCAIFSLDIAAQYSVSNFKDELKAKVNMAEFHDPYAFNIKYDEMPHPTGKDKMRAYLRARKLEAQRQTPLKPGVTYQNRSIIPPPEILA